MESKIVTLRERGERQLERARRTAVIVAGAGAVLGVAAVSAFVIYRLTRPPTPGERARRLLPSGAVTLPARLRKRVPPMRLYVGDRQVGEGTPPTRWEWVVLQAARTAGSAAAATLAARLLAGMATERMNRDHDEQG